VQQQAKEADDDDDEARRDGAVGVIAQLATTRAANEDAEALSALDGR